MSKVWPKLSFEKANALCREFVEIKDVPSYSAMMCEAGYTAFMPRVDFINSFAETPEELEIHQRCDTENARERLGQPTPIPVFDEDLKHLYWSPYLQVLRAERDRVNGCPAEQLSERYKGRESAWRREIDPCQRRLVQSNVSQRERHEELFSAMLEQERQALKDEAERSRAQVNGPSFTFDSEGRYAFLGATMERQAAMFGFQYEQASSLSRPPLLSKPINDAWHLSWSIENTRAFLHSQLYGSFLPLLKLQSNRLRRGAANATPGEVLYLRYTTVVPGFPAGYTNFFNFDQLERVVEAHLYLYSLLERVIESGIHKHLDNQ